MATIYAPRLRARRKSSGSVWRGELTDFQRRDLMYVAISRRARDRGAPLSLDFVEARGLACFRVHAVAAARPRATGAHPCAAHQHLVAAIAHRRPVGMLAAHHRLRSAGDSQAAEPPPAHVENQPWHP